MIWVIGGLIIRRHHALEVANDDALWRLTDEIVGHDGYFAAAAWRINHVGRNRKTCRMTAQRFHDFDALRHRGAEVSRALDQITLIQIVGTHAITQQFMAQTLDDVRAIVHACEQHRLIAERDARIRQFR